MAVVSKSMRAFLLLVFLVMGCRGEEKQPIELGTVKWSRDLSATLASSKKSGKPVFLLFQEVPG